MGVAPCPWTAPDALAFICSAPWPLRAQGLIALALATPDGKGKLMMITPPNMTIAAEVPLEGKPQSLILYQPKGSYIAYLSLALEGGGVMAYELPPAAPGDDSSPSQPDAAASAQSPANYAAPAAAEPEPEFDLM